uniref:Relaxosome protein TraY n=1 Tax=Aliivibrio fischeri TaxID=668 RepID=H2ERW4_ALIFS|nr:TraY domain-containing protein [Aliivibrio fischeri]AEY78131.1 hypothetical protein [Aliivibrio fischeri]
MSKTKKQGAVGLWFELDKETNHLLKLQAEKTDAASALKPLLSSKETFNKKR